MDVFENNTNNITNNTTNKTINVVNTLSYNERKMFKESFTICYLILFGTAAITFIEALRNTNVHARHILNLETAVSLTAGVVYGMFREETNKQDFNLEEIIHYRYIDWAITTPMLLLILVLFIDFHSSSKLRINIYILIIVLNYIMLLFGYMGERKLMDKRTAQTIGFIALGSMLFVIYYYFLKHSKNIAPLVLFIIFSIVWSLYGVAAELDEKNKNLMYNALDILSKVFFGLGLWSYYGGIFKF